MLSVGAIRFEDRFCAIVGCGEVGGFQHGVLCTWQLPGLAVEKPRSSLAGPLLLFLTQMGVNKAPLPF